MVCDKSSNSESHQATIWIEKFSINSEIHSARHIKCIGTTIPLGLADTNNTLNGLLIAMKLQYRYQGQSKEILS